MSDATLREKAAAFIAEHEGCDEYCSAACDALPIVREVARLEAELAEATHAAQMATEDNRQISQDVRRLSADKKRLEVELAAARNWKGDFQEACRQRDKVEAERDALREALVFIHNATLAKKKEGEWWLDVGEPMIRAALTGSVQPTRLDEALKLAEDWEPPAPSASEAP